MKKRLFLNHPFVLALAAWMICLGMLPPSVSAMPSESLAVVELGSMREAQINQILQVLSRPEARLHLITAGISERDVKKALAKLNDAQLADLSKKADTIRTGGDALGVIVVVLVIVLLIILIVNLMNKDIEIKDKKK